MSILWNNIKHFRSWEFDDPDFPGSGREMDEKPVIILNMIREETGWPIHVTAGIDTLGRHHAKNSYHNEEQGALAVDWYFGADIPSRIQYYTLESYGIPAIGIYYDWRKWNAKKEEWELIPIGFHTDWRNIEKCQRWVRNRGEYIYLLR